MSFPGLDGAGVEALKAADLLRRSAAWTLERRLAFLGWSRRRLAKEAGTNKVTVGAVMNMTGTCSLSTLSRLLAACGARALVLPEELVHDDAREMVAAGIADPSSARPPVEAAE